MRVNLNSHLALIVGSKPYSSTKLYLDPASLSIFVHYEDMKIPGLPCGAGNRDSCGDIFLAFAMINRMQCGILGGGIIQK
jgi:hypothetical protein